MKNFDFWGHKWALSLTAAILLGVSYPPFNLAILQIPAFICLFRIAVLCETKRQVIYYTYPSLVLWNLITTYWLMMATVAGGIAAILANAVLMLIPLLLIRSLFRSSINPVFASIMAASIWVSYEFLHHNWDLAWPWLTLGNGWSNLTGAIQYISVTGVFGISFWIVLSSASFFLYLQNPVRKNLYAAIILFSIFPALSVVTAVTSTTHADGKPVNVAIVQPNSDSYQRFGGLSSLDELLDKLLVMSDTVRTEETDVIIWPENALDASLSYSNMYFDRIQDSLRVWDTQLITGTGYAEYFYDEDTKPQVVRYNHAGVPFNVFNAAFHFQPDQPAGIYRKGKLVPVVERFPFVEFFQSIDRLELVNWGQQMGYGLGLEATTFNVNGAETTALICYDSVFPGWVNKFVENGATFLTIVTNDGWWGNSSGHIQHFAYARLRAIEHRMWVTRSANNGISGIISPDGKVQVQTEYWTEDAFRFTINSNNNPTFYARYGNWIAYISLIVSIFGLGIVYIKNRNRD